MNSEKLLCEIVRRNPYIPLPDDNGSVYHFGPLYLGEHRALNCVAVQSIDELSLRDILLNRRQRVNLPDREECNTPARWLKRKLLRILWQLVIDYRSPLESLRQAFLDPIEGNVIMVEGKHVWEICQTHLDPSFSARLYSIGPSKELVRAWAEAVIEHPRIDPSCGLTVITNICEEHLLRAYRVTHPNRRVILRFHDDVRAGLRERFPNIDTLRCRLNRLRAEGLVDEIESYARSDAEALGALYRPNGCNPDVMSKLNLAYRSGLLSFQGMRGANAQKCDPRLTAIDSLRTQLAQKMPGAEAWIRVTLLNSIFKMIPYRTYLEEVAANEVMMDLYRLRPDEGFSYRIPEALFLNRKIITNRTNLVSEPFYSPERVFILGKDDPGLLRAFLEHDLAPLPDEILKLYDATLWWTEKDPITHTKHKDTYL